jgi:small subunit ribosomal protein S28e
MAKKQAKESSEQKSRDSKAEVVELIGRVGTKQGGMQVRCKIVDGREEGKVMRRNVFGPVRVGDILVLRETEIEAPQLRGSRR